MALMRGLGRLVKEHPLATLGIAGGIAVAPPLAFAAAGASAYHGMMHPRERNTPWLDAIFEGVLGDPQADRAFLGRDIGFSAILPLPQVPTFGFTKPFQELSYINNYASSQTLGYVGAMNHYSDYNGVEGVNRFTQEVATGAVENGYQKDAYYPNSNYSYRPRTTRGNNGATGDIVFGSYNLRHGG